MSIDKARYYCMRDSILQNPQKLIDIEREYMGILLEIVKGAAPHIHREFARPKDLFPFWINYSPRQRGRSASGDAVPWGDMGEKVVSGYFSKVLSETLPSITFPGSPIGADVRFATEDALIHFDFKLTGPNDRDDEIVASPNQISGDGAEWQDGGVKNTSHLVVGPKGGRMNFEPTLPPLYELDGRPLICLTFFLEVVYKVQEFGDQPLQHLELACVPNGLLMFQGPDYATNYNGLLIPGKDDRTKLEGKRVRVRLDPLARIASWRSVIVEPSSDTWKVTSRSLNSEKIFP